MTKNDRGLGSPNMGADQKKAIQSKGGSASPQNFKNNPELAREAGRKGGLKRKKKSSQSNQSESAEVPTQ